jgi:hypothetical protein
VEVAQDGEVGKEAQIGLPAARTRRSGPGGGRWCWSACVRDTAALRWISGPSGTSAARRHVPSRGTSFLR